MTSFTRMTAVVAGMLIAATPVFAADVQPPLQALRHQNYTLVVAERLDRPVVDGKMSVRVIEPLRGDMDSAGEMEILVLEGDEEIVDAGVRYLLFYSDVERVSFKPRTEVRRPDRRKLLHIEGADPAVRGSPARRTRTASPGPETRCQPASPDRVRYLPVMEIE